MSEEIPIPAGDTDRPVTLQMVATRAGVSVMTASRVLNDSPLVTAATAARVREASEALGYNPAHNQIARQMVLRRHGQRPLNQLLGLFFPPLFYRDLEARYFGPIYDGIMTEAMFARFGVLTSYVSYPHSETTYTPYTFLNELPAVYSHGDVDAALLYGHLDEQQRLVAMLHAERNFADRPILTLTEPIAGCSSVLTDDAQGAREVMAHLLALGHRRIVHFYTSPVNHTPYLNRLQGCEEMLRAHGLDPAEALVDSPWDTEQPDASLAALAETLATHPKVTAILAPNDAIANTLMGFLRARGLRIPEDLSLVGHDDSLGDTSDELALTTVRLPLAEIGRTAARILIGQLTGAAAPETVVLPVAFIPRATTGEARGR
jgi:DNA-binding LacI/PurR family transcriptional regulator